MNKASLTLKVSKHKIAESPLEKSSSNNAQEESCPEQFE